MPPTPTPTPTPTPAPTPTPSPSVFPGPVSSIFLIIGNNQFIASFLPPTIGLPIDFYRIRYTPVGGGASTVFESPDAATVVTVTQVPNGQTYDVEIAAVNATGEGVYTSGGQVQVIDAVVPGIVRNAVCTPGDEQFTVQFDEPLSDGNSPITMYRVNHTPVGGGSTTNSEASASPVVVTNNVVNGTTYNVVVIAFNLLGPGPALPIGECTPVGPPDPARDVVCTAGDGQISVTFNAPLDTGGSPVLNYTLTSAEVGSSNVFTEQGVGSPLVETEVTNGNVYNVTLRTTTLVGLSSTVDLGQCAPEPSNVLPTSPNFVAGGSGGDHTLAMSDNGVTWFGNGNTVFSTQCFSVRSDGVSRWVAAGIGTNALATSDDGVNWTGLGDAGGVFSLAGSALAYSASQSRWVAGGFGTANTLAHSDDNGSTWTGNGTATFSQFCLEAAHSGPAGGNRFVAVGGPPNTIAFSDDGETWTGLGTSVFSAQGDGIAYNNAGRCVACGFGGNALAFSDDAESWTGDGTATFATGFGVASDGSRFVAVGSGPTNTMAWSDDGQNWNGLGASIFPDGALTIAWNGVNLWVAGGRHSPANQSSIATSADGINWSYVSAANQTPDPLFTGECSAMSFKALLPPP